MDKVASNVYLLVPAGVEISTDDRRRLGFELCGDLDLVHVVNDGVAFGFLGGSSQGIVLAVPTGALLEARFQIRTYVKTPNQEGGASGT